jgi:hypothetical protein
MAVHESGLPSVLDDLHSIIQQYDLHLKNKWPRDLAIRPGESRM